MARQTGRLDCLVHHSALVDIKARSRKANCFQDVWFRPIGGRAGLRHAALFSQSGPVEDGSGLARLTRMINSINWS
jgi:hypothetical protein